jgi:hypothetical protein
MTFSGRLLLLGLLVPGGCASRSIPTSYPENAASSAQAPEAELANVTVALSGEPPLPGEPAGAWGTLAGATAGEGSPSTAGEGEPAAAQPSPSDAADPHAGHGTQGGHVHHGAH